MWDRRIPLLAAVKVQITKILRLELGVGSIFVDCLNGPIQLRLQVIIALDNCNGRFRGKQLAFDLLAHLIISTLRRA